MRGYKNKANYADHLAWILLFILLAILSCDQNRTQPTFNHNSPDQPDIAGSINSENTDSIINKAAGYFEKGNYIESLTISSEAYDYALKNGDQRLMAILLNNIGLVHWRLNDFDAAMEAYNQSAIIAEKIGQTRLLGLTYTNKALILRNQKKFKEALINNHKSILLLKEVGAKMELGISYNNHGQIFKELKNMDSARLYYSEALKIYEQVDFKNGMSATFFNLAEIFTSENNKEEALKAAENSLELGMLSESKVRINEAYQKLFEVYEYFNQPDSALKYHKIHTDLKISSLTDNQAEKILEHQARFGNEVKNLRIQNLEKEKVIATGKIWLYSGSILIIMLIISFLIYRKLSKTKFKKRQLEFELKNSENILKIKKRELKSYIIDLSRKNMLISDLQNQITEENKVGEEQNNRIASLLNQKILTEDDWRIFKNKFNLIYPFFFTNIKQLNIDLTEAEIRFLVLFRLKLTAKEIANTIGISLQSVRTCKMRLKRKLKENHYESVDDFIKCI